MPPSEEQTRLQIGHVLFIDIVGYSKLLVNEQSGLLRELTEVVSGTHEFREAEAEGKLIRLPTGDGMALVFRTDPEAPAQCALEIARALKEHPRIALRMGIHSGPVNEVVDVNQRQNIAGAGINMAQRVMDCGDAGHILVSKHVAEDLEQHDRWRPLLHDLGSCEVKHGMRVAIANLYSDEVGNPLLPKKFQALKKHSARMRWAAITVALLALAGVVAGIVMFSRYRVRSTLTAPEKSIAVLPFENFSTDRENAFFTDGMQDDILTALAKVGDLKVISRTSVMTYASTAIRNLRDIGEALGVTHVLEGSVRRVGNRVRVTAQLIDTRTGAHLWAETYDRELADVFAIQTDIAQRITDELQAKLSPKEKAAIEERPTKEIAAYDLYLRAKALNQANFSTDRAKENLLEAARLLDQATKRDPEFFLAFCELAAVHDQLYFENLDHTPARLALAEAAVKTALRLRPDAGEAHLALAQHLYHCYLDYDGARAELAIAQRTLPNDARIFTLAGYILRRQGHWEDSTRNLERALELDPRNLDLLQQISMSYRLQRRFAKAARAMDRALELVPDDVDTRVNRALLNLDLQADTRPLHETIAAIIAKNPAAAADVASAWLHLAFCERDWIAASRALAALPRDSVGGGAVQFPYSYNEAIVARASSNAATAERAFAEARAEVQRALVNEPDYAPSLCLLGMIDAQLGQKQDAMREGRRAVELTPIVRNAIDGEQMMTYLAIIYAWVGEKDLAVKQIATTLQFPGGLSYGDLRLSPDWDPLRGDARFEKLVANLAPKPKDD